MKNIPFIDLSRTVAPHREEILQGWESALDGLEFVGGKSVAELEAVIKNQLQVENALTCANGTDAILIGLQALGVGPGKKVALPNLTFWATFEAVAQLGATPVLIDVDPLDLQMDFGQFKQAFEKFRFDAAILVHLYGWCTPQLREFRDFCASRGIALLEDGAQSYGVKHDGESVYACAQVATISFYPAKVIGGCMDGGAITSSDAKLIELCRSLCNHGRATHYSYSHVGWNSRMSGLNARFLLQICGKAESIVSSRAQAEKLYREHMADVPGLKLHGPPDGVSGNGYLNVIELESASVSKVAELLKVRGIGTGRVYPETMDAQPAARRALKFGDLAASRGVCARILNLPLFYGITEDEIRISVDCLRGSLQS